MLKLNKCYFAQREVKYFGHTVSACRCLSRSGKDRGVIHIPSLRKREGAQAVLRTYQLLPPICSQLFQNAQPLHRLLTKENNFVWDSKCQNAFEELKHKLVSPPILAFPDFSQEFILCTDASDSAVGCVLSQIQGGQERVVSHWRRQLQKAERNYSTNEKEALAVVAAI